MRQMTAGQILVFTALFSLIILLAVVTSYLTVAQLPLGDFRGIVVTVFALVLVYAYGFIVYRVFLGIMPLPEGEVLEKSRGEFAAQVNILFYLMLFNSLIRTHFVPVPIMRLVYLALGARLGRNTYSAGAILDPPRTRIGANCIIGHDAVLFSHAIEGDRLLLNWIRIGDNVTIGATAVIMSDVVIGDGAIISAGAIVTKGTRVGASEIWGGVPARRLGSAGR